MKLTFYNECTRLNDMIVKYMSSGFRLIPNVPNYVSMLQTNDSETIDSLAKFILRGLKLYAQCSI